MPCRVVLLYGDAHAVARRATEIVVAVAGSRSDPFRVSVLERDDPSLRSELSAASLSGGRRVVEVRDCLDRSVPYLAEAADGIADVLAIATAGSLTRRSRLKVWAEEHPKVASVTCEGRSPGARRASAVAHLAEFGISAASCELDLLQDALADDEVDARQAVERLALFSGPVELLTRAAISDVLTRDQDGSIMAVIDRALLGDAAAAIGLLAAVLAGGGAGVGLTRILGSDLLRLGRAVAELAAGASVGTALQRARVFPQDARRPTFDRAIRCWDAMSVRAALADTRAAEAACKTTGANEWLVCARLLDIVARRARHRS